MNKELHIEAFYARAWDPILQEDPFQLNLVLKLFQRFWTYSSWLYLDDFDVFDFDVFLCFLLVNHDVVWHGTVWCEHWPVAWSQVRRSQQVLKPGEYLDVLDLMLFCQQTNKAHCAWDYFGWFDDLGCCGKKLVQQHFSIECPCQMSDTLFLSEK